MSRSALFIVAHPYLHKSRANGAIVRAMRDLDGVTFHSLYDRYPYFHIDVAREQELLAAHELIVIQHPLYWYSMPPLLKMWVDEVLEFGWAYGPNGTHLQGKSFLLSVTAGGSYETYAEGGTHQYPLETLLLPWKQTIHLCNMHWHRPRIIHASLHATDQRLREHAEDIRSEVVTLMRGGGPS